MRNVFFRREVFSWALYDWANSAFATTVMAGFFPVFFSAISQDISAERSQFWFNITLAGSSLLVAVVAPLLGAISDRGGSRKKFLVTFAAAGILMTAALAWVHAGQWWIGLLLYGLGTIGFSGANVFYDSMIVDVAEEEDFDLVSAFGYAMGYIGGGLLFAVNVLMAQKPEMFGRTLVYLGLAEGIAIYGLVVSILLTPMLASKLLKIRLGKDGKPKREWLLPRMLKAGIAAAKAGQREKAHALLMAVLRADEEN